MIDRRNRPLTVRQQEVALPGVEKGNLKNGLDVWLVQRHDLPVAVVNLVLGAGSDRDSRVLPGVATMTADTLDAGTSAMNALQIAESLEAIGASFGVRSMFDGASSTMVVLSKHLERAMEIFAGVIGNPAFPPSEVERVRNHRLNSLLQQRDRPATIASLVFYSTIFGTDHPYGIDPSGTEQSLKAIAREDLVSFHDTYYTPNNGTLIAVGNMSFDRIKAALEPFMGRWESGSVPDGIAESRPSSGGRKIILIDKPGAPQSEIRIGYPCLARSTPDYFPLLIMNRILGGQFSSRLNVNLRERRGLTYGARTQFVFHKRPGPFFASAGVVSNGTATAIQETLFEMEKMREDGVSAEELEFSRGGLAGGFALSFETANQQAGAMQNIALYGLPMDYYSHYLESLNSVTGRDVARVAQLYLNTAEMSIVVVGDVGATRSEIEALGLGEVVICDAEGRPVPEPKGSA